jgi:predicted kinase
VWARGRGKLDEVLIVLSGLSGTGKTTIARELARAAAGVHLRIDSIEQSLRNDGWEVYAEGYHVAHAVALDNLRVGRLVVADSVNPWPLTREAWRSVAARAGTRVLDVEVVCSDTAEHRRRVESRHADIDRHRVPTWQEVVDRDYRPWEGDRVTIDTARSGVDECVQAIVAAMARVPAWDCECSVDVRVPVSEAWGFMSDVRNWSDPPAEFSLDGAFESGASGVTRMPGHPPAAWTLREVRAGESYTIEGGSFLDRARLLFYWRFAPGSEGGTRMTQRIELCGENAATYVVDMKTGFGANIEPGMRRIASLIEERAGVRQ